MVLHSPDINAALYKALLEANVPEELAERVAEGVPRRSVSIKF